MQDATLFKYLMYVFNLTVILPNLSLRMTPHQALSLPVHFLYVYPVLHHNLVKIAQLIPLLPLVLLECITYLPLLIDHDLHYPRELPVPGVQDPLIHPSPHLSTHLFEHLLLVYLLEGFE